MSLGSRSPRRATLFWPMHLGLFLIVISELLVGIVLPGTAAPVSDDKDRTFHIAYDSGNDKAVNTCFQTALKQIKGNATCLVFVESTHNQTNTDHLGASNSSISTKNKGPNANTIMVKGTSKSGPCGFKNTDNMKTIYIGDKCISEDICLKLAGRAISGAKQTTANVIPDLAYNKCKEGCAPCMNGGYVEIGEKDGDKCECVCIEGFKGKRCEIEEVVAKNETELSSECGDTVITNETGVIALKSISQATVCTWVLKSNDTWSLFEIEFESLDIGTLAQRKKRCSESINFQGFKNLTSIQCSDMDGPKYLKTPFTSDGNIVEIHFNADKKSQGIIRKGPVIKYKRLTPKIDDEVDESIIPSTNAASPGVFVSGFSILVLAVLLLCSKV